MVHPTLSANFLGLFDSSVAFGPIKSYTSLTVTLQKRGAVHYFRAMIPKDLRVLYGRKEIIYSLKTKDAREARRLARQASVTIDAEFKARRGRRPPEQLCTFSLLDDATIRGLCDTWRHGVPER